jgi:hypothetical protein
MVSESVVLIGFQTKPTVLLAPAPTMEAKGFSTRLSLRVEIDPLAP